MMQDAQYASLSTRQAEIARFVVSGKSAREIALALTLSPRTVETHIAAIYNKYGVSSRTELIIAVLGRGARSPDHLTPADFADTNLPARRTGLLGRVADVASVKSLMEESRLVTVTGAGGVGKTRVALAVGEVLLENSKDGVWFVELASLARGSSVADAVARVLSIKPSVGVSSIKSLRVQLSKKSIVLIFDNCEHLIAEAALVADALLSGCPQLRILATSRETLHIAGERTYRLPSLLVPSSADSIPLDAVRGATFAAIELFATRAQAVDYRFTLTDKNIGFVAEICRHVDGIHWRSNSLQHG